MTIDTDHPDPRPFDPVAVLDATDHLKVIDGVLMAEGTIPFWLDDEPGELVQQSLFEQEPTA